MDLLLPHDSSELQASLLVFPLAAERQEIQEGERQAFKDGCFLFFFFLAALALHCFARVFSSCGSRMFLAVRFRGVKSGK